MKKLLSILTVLLVVTAMLHFSVARHYCQGELVASKISLSGSLATCGMEGNEGDCRHGRHDDRFESHCCDDALASCYIDNNYTPATRATTGFSQTKINVLFTPPEILVRFTLVNFRAWSDISPPGQLMTSAVDLSDIRVFRI